MELANLVQETLTMKQEAHVVLMAQSLTKWVNAEQEQDPAFKRSFIAAVATTHPNDIKAARDANLNDMQAATLITSIHAVAALSETFSPDILPENAQEQLDDLVTNASENGSVYSDFSGPEDMASSINNEGPISQMAFLIVGNSLDWFINTIPEIITPSMKMSLG